MWGLAVLTTLLLLQNLQVKAILDAEVCVLVNSREIRGATLVACLAALRSKWSSWSLALSAIR